MKVVSLNVTHGPNHWTKRFRNLIVLQIDTNETGIGEISQKDFEEAFRKLFPSFSEFSNHWPYTAQALKFIAEELLHKAGMPVKYSALESATNGNDSVLVLSYEIEKIGIYVIRTAVKIVRALMVGDGYDIEEETDELHYLRSKYALGPTTAFILDEVKERKIPYKRFEASSLITLGYGSKQKKMRTAVVDSTSGLGMEIASDKEETKQLLAEEGLPIPLGFLVYSETELRETIERVKFPLVIKPLNGNHGRGVSTNIITPEQAVVAFNMAREISSAVIVEEYITGNDYRFLLINFRLIAVALRTPATIIGDGKSTIEELINSVNNDPDRGDDPDNVLAPVRVDVVTKKILTQKNLTLSSVLPVDEKLVLKDTANISTGGTSIDVTDRVHPENIFLAERVARIFNLDICGIDIIASDINVPLNRNTGGIIEVNAGPGLRMHTNPTIGIGRNVARPIIDMLFPSPPDAFIPVIAVAETSGSSATTRLMARFAKQAGFKVGFASSEGVYIQDHLIFKEDHEDHASTRAVLFDATINFAVLECEMDEILRSGLGFDNCNISIIINISESRQNKKTVHSMEEQVKIKKLIAGSTYQDGYAILNAEDDEVYSLRSGLKCKIALFSTNENNERVKKHYETGGMAAIMESGFITVYNGRWKTRVENIINIPLNFEERLECLLPAVLAAFILNFNTEDIRTALHTFIPSHNAVPVR